jgi:hypothetical protein
MMIVHQWYSDSRSRNDFLLIWCLSVNVMNHIIGVYIIVSCVIYNWNLHMYNVEHVYCLTRPIRACFCMLNLTRQKSIIFVFDFRLLEFTVRMLSIYSSLCHQLKNQGVHFMFQGFPQYCICIIWTCEFFTSLLIWRNVDAVYLVFPNKGYTITS